MDKSRPKVDISPTCHLFERREPLVPRHTPTRSDYGQKATTKSDKEQTGQKRKQFGHMTNLAYVLWSYVRICFRFCPFSVIVPQFRSISPTAMYRILATHLIRVPRRLLAVHLTLVPCVVGPSLLLTRCTTFQTSLRVQSKFVRSFIRADDPLHFLPLLPFPRSLGYVL